jgi:hypothetical protein
MIMGSMGLTHRKSDVPADRHWLGCQALRLLSFRSMSFLTRLAAGAVTIVLLAGCLDYDGGGGCEPGPNGIAGNGNFSYVCTGPADPHCDRDSLDRSGTLPSAIARGGRFQLRFQGQSSGVTPISSRSAARSMCRKSRRASTG